MNHEEEPALNDTAAFSPPAHRRRSAPRLRRSALRSARAFFAVLVTLVMVFPLFWLVSTALKTEEEAMSAQIVFWPAVPQFQNFHYAMTKVPMLRYFLNTLVVTAMQMTSELLLGILAAYAFSKGRFYGQHLLFLVVLGAMMIPIQVTFVPLYVIIARAGFLSSYAGVWIAGCISSYTIFLLRQAFLSVDDSYLDAGRVDGMGRMGIIFRVLTPMCKPTVITVGLTAFIGGWNGYFWPKIIVKDEMMYVLTIGVQRLRSTFGHETVNNYHQIMAGLLLSILPVFVVFAVFQKHMLSGFTRAAMK